MDADPLPGDPAATTETHRCAWRARPGRQLEPGFRIQHFELWTGHGTALGADQVQRERARRRVLGNVHGPSAPQISVLIGCKDGWISSSAKCDVDLLVGGESTCIDLHRDARGSGPRAQLHCRLERSHVYVTPKLCGVGLSP